MNKHSSQPIAIAECQARPSLALTKYWGKENQQNNIPAVPSLAITLDALKTTTKVTIVPKITGSVSEDRVTIDTKIQTIHRFQQFFSHLRHWAAKKGWKGPEFSVQVSSESNFPTAAGMASSASGFAALATACVHALKLDLREQDVSALARIGSASAARSIYGGFTLLPAKAESAVQLYDETWWPQLRVLVLAAQNHPKKISSRKAMEQSRLTSPYYDAWKKDAPITTQAACKALEDRNISSLGPLIQHSYLRMFSTMLSANPPLRYWIPKTLELLDFIDDLRNKGLEVWETMDAGPQVKVFCLEHNLPTLLKELDHSFPAVKKWVCQAGKSPEILQ